MKKNNWLPKLYDSKIFWAIVSLFISTLFWIYITGTQEQYITVSFNDVQVELSGADLMMESKGFVVTDMETSTVDLTFYGKRADIGWLSSSDITAVIDLTRITKSGENLVSYTLEYPNSTTIDSVTVIEQSPQYITISVEKVSTKTVTVRGSFVGTTADGYTADELVFEPSTIVLTGPESSLENIDYVWATLGGEDLTKSKSSEVSYVYMDADENVLDYSDISADYDTVTATLNISAIKEVALTVSLVGGSGATEENTIVTIEPATIFISGDSAIVEGINKISLATIDLSDFSSTYENTYTIVLDNNVTNVTGITEAKVSLEVVGTSVKTLNVSNISCINIPDNVDVEFLTQSLDVVIRAQTDDIDDITSDNIRVVADLDDYYGTGTATVTVRVYVDGYTDAGAVGDYKIVINLI